LIYYFLKNNECKIFTMNSNYVYPMKTLKEMQEDAMKKNNGEIERKCRCPFFCLCWSLLLLFTCYILVFVSIILIRSSKDEEQIFIIKEYLESGSGGGGN
jgi:hypothetical protein